MAHPNEHPTIPPTPVYASPRARPWSSSSSSSSRTVPKYCIRADVAAARHAETRALNPNIDRTIAKRDIPDDTKLVVIIQHPTLSDPTRLDYPHDVDWSDQKSISSVNAWRSRIFKYWLGNLSGKEPVPRETFFFTDEEKAWLLRETPKSGFKWTKLVRCFNEEFEGVIVKDHVRRPLRTGRQLERLYTKLLKEEADDSGVEYKKAYADDGIDEAGSESELEEGEIREYPRVGKFTRPWEL